MPGPLALVEQQVNQYPGGEFEDWVVVDTRNGKTLAVRSELSSANCVMVYLNATYPPGVVAPAYDSLVHEVHMTRVGGEPETPLCRWASDPLNLAAWLPSGVGDDPTDLWKPRVES